MDRSELDPLTILEALGVSDATAVVPVRGGWDTAIWRVERGGGASALRVFRPEQAETCRREVAALRAAADGGIAVPRVQAEGPWRGRPALLLSWCAGRPLLDELAERPWRARALGVAFGRIQARIHRVAAPAALRRPAGAWIAWAGPDEARLQSRLRALAPDAAALLHLDYHPLNVLTDGTRVTGVLDWANARAGDRRADLARTLAILRLAPVGPGVPRGTALLARRLLVLGWHRGYRRAAGPVRGMAPFYAWAGTSMERDLRPKLGRPGVWLEPRDLERVRRWASAWKRRAGIAE